MVARKHAERLAVETEKDPRLVELILRKLSEGASEADLLDAYPRLTREDIQAAIGYAADTVAHEETLILQPVRKRSKR